MHDTPRFAAVLAKETSFEIPILAEFRYYTRFE